MNYSPFDKKTDKLHEHLRVSSGIRLFKLSGFEVSLDVTWFLLALLITWSLAKGYFPAFYVGLSPLTYWVMGIFGAIGLFFSIVVHEFAHSLVGRHYGVPIAGIKLFLFGGIAEIHESPKTPKVEFLMTIAGPITSFMLSFIFLQSSIQF